MMKREAFVPLALACLILGGCTREPAHEEEPAEAAAPASVKTAPVRSGAVDDVLDVTGETQALSTVRLASPIAGRVTFLDAQPGDTVHKGEVVARVLSLENEAGINGIDVMRRGGAGAPDLAELRRDLGARDVSVRSPISGTIAARLHGAGEQVAAGDVLVEAFDPHTIAAVCDVPMTALARIRNGLEVEVAGAGFSSKGTVAGIVPSVAGTTVTVPVRVTLAERPPAGVLHEPLRVRIWLAKQRPALLVPRTALVSSSAGAHADVIVAADGKAHPREIEIGRRTDDEIEVVSGLAAGEQVVTEGAYGLADGAPLRPTEGAEGGEPR